MTLSERRHRARKLIAQVEQALNGAPTSQELETLQEDLIEAANHVKALALDVRKIEKAEDDCLSDGTPLYPRRKPTREERLQGLADRGCDTWEEYRGER